MVQIAPPRSLGGETTATPTRGYASYSARRRDACAARASAVEDRPPSLWREVLLVLVFYGAYTLTRLILNPAGTGSAFAHAGDILSLERSFGIDVELGLNKALVATPGLARAASLFYATAHFVVTLCVLVWLYRRRPAQYRWLRTALMAATAVALFGFWLYPLAPPRFVGLGFVDPVTALHSVGLYSAHGSAALTNQFAAMPSMHAGWALWCGFAVFRLAKSHWARAAGAFYPVATVLVILATANHYVLDAVAGIAIIVIALSGAWLVHSRILLGKENKVIHGVGHKLTNPASIGDIPSVHV
jgi:hypothetical protein